MHAPPLYHAVLEYFFSATFVNWFFHNCIHIPTRRKEYLLSQWLLSSAGSRYFCCEHNFILFLYSSILREQMLPCGRVLDLSRSIIPAGDASMRFYHIASNTEGSQHIKASNINILQLIYSSAQCFIVDLHCRLLCLILTYSNVPSSCWKDVDKSLTHWIL